MSAALLWAILLPPTLFLLWTIHDLAYNYRKARKVGLPIIIVPISPENPIWMILARYFLPILQYIPFGNGYFTRFCHIGWEYDEKTRAHIELGDAFMFATPGKNWIYLCNADTAHDIMNRERQTNEFERPGDLMAMLDAFGPNISTVNGKDWQRQRKICAASFNEKSNFLVWNEAFRQGSQMIQYWVSAGSKGTNTLQYDTRTLALNVLAYVAFGKSFEFQGSEDRGSHTKSRSQDPLSYRDALAIILHDALLMLALGQQLTRRLAFIPRLGRLSDAAEQFKMFMKEMYSETSEAKRGEKATGNLISSLVRASTHEKLITPEEVIGNIFVFSFAGHDTTAHSFAFNFMLLAGHIEVQDWMAEEIRYVLDGEKDLENRYELFPRLVRSLAVLLETLRLYDPILSVVKGTGAQPAQLTIGDKNVLVPAGTRIVVNLNALHSLPRYWGNDGLEWRPSRWIQTKPGTGPVHDREYIVMPEKGTYIPFGEGMRSCPGKKFAQVEHVAVMASIFSEHYVVPVKQKGEDDSAARARARNTLKDTGMRLLLQMLHPEKTPLEWKKRG